MFEDDLPESDSSDEDFVPTGERSDVSEEESDDDVGEQGKEDEDVVNKRKKTKSKHGSRKKKKKLEEDIPTKIEEEEEKPKDENPEEKKKRADALWADFLNDCGPVVKKKSDESVSHSKPLQSSRTSLLSDNDHLKAETSSKCKSNESGLKVNNIFKDFETGNQGGSEKVTEVYEFAGEKVVVEKKLDRTKRPISRGGGVAAILSQINKKTKLSTLEKSKLDWDSFKESQGIDEEIAAHNRGKNGYLEKRDFLERADLRQFEIEKKMREHSRSKRL